MLRWILTDIDWFLLIVKIRYIFDCHMKISLLSFSSIFDDVIKKAQNNSKMAIVGPGIFFTSTFTSRFQIPEQQIADRWKNSRSGSAWKKVSQESGIWLSQDPCWKSWKGVENVFFTTLENASLFFCFDKEQKVNTYSESASDSWSRKIALDFCYDVIFRE